MRSRIKFVGREDWTGMEQGRHAIVIVRTVDGRRFEEEVWHKPMTREELDEKFCGLVQPRFGAASAAALRELCQELPAAGSVRPLVKNLRGR